MPFPKLSPLQSRLAASLGASLMLLLLYLAFSSTHFAYAADVDSIRPEDHNHDRLYGGPFLDVELESDLELREPSYEPDFLGMDRGIVGRAPTSNEPIPLINNVRQTDNIPMGSTVSYIFTNASLWGNKSTMTPLFGMIRRQLLREEEAVEQDGIQEMDTEDGAGLKPRQISSSSSNRTLYISVTACDQPLPINTSGKMSPAPQLQLYISVSEDNKTPGPNKSPQEMIELDRGYGLYKVNATSNVYMGIYGKNDTAYQGVWNAEIAASIDAPYHYWHKNVNMAFLDSDSSSALLTADDPSVSNGNISDADSLAGKQKPYVLFASRKNASTIYGLQNSACGLATKAEFVPDGVRPGQDKSNVQTWLSRKRDETATTEQRFSVNGLAAGTKYNAILAIPRNPSNTGTVGGGGQVFSMAQFRTLSESNCALVTNLTFCENINYAVPSNPNMNDTQLRSFYDNYTTTHYEFFKRAMEQIPCNTTSSAQYSLATNCTMCETAYKAWFCSVSLPRCTDYTRDEFYLQPRNIGQPFPNGTLLPTDSLQFLRANSSAAGRGSRNPVIDQVIKPGPYKELLPCDDLCYNVVKNCPAAIGFTCPLPGYIGFNTSYAQRFNMSQSDRATLEPPQCNFPGAIMMDAGSQALRPQILSVSLLAMSAMMFI